MKNLSKKVNFLDNPTPYNHNGEGNDYHVPSNSLAPSYNYIPPDYIPLKHP